MIETAGAGRKERYSWGEMEWHFAAKEEGPTALSSARMVLRSGQAGALHRHANCEEILHVVSGRIVQRVGELESEMGPGDSAFIPMGVPHRSRSIGSEDAVLLLSYSAARREYEEVGATGRAGEGGR